MFLIQTAALVFAVTFLAVKLASLAKRKRFKLPPGPCGLSIVGYLPFFGENPPVKFNDLRRTYGDVFSIRMASWPAVVINGREAIEEALVTKGDDFSGRPAFTSSLLFNDGTNFSFSDFGPVWKARRKIAINVLHAFTNACDSPFEEIVRNEAKANVREFLAHGKYAFYPMTSMEVAAASMVYQVCYGTHQNIRDDETFLDTVETLRNFENFARAGSVIDAVPWLRFFMPWVLTKFLRFLQKTAEGREKQVEEHLKNYTKSSVRDITDGLIRAGDNLTDQDHAMGLDKKRIIEILDDVFGAGSATIRSALKWFLLLMAAYPEAQERLFQQIDQVVGQGQEPNLSDRINLPLVEAVINEVLRFGSIVPFALPHSTLRDTTLQGFDIPQGTIVLVNLHSIYVDEELWGDPGNFRPERFLKSSDGSLDRSFEEQVAAFSLGRRRCLGENTARMELFLFVATLCQRIKIYKPPGQPDYSLVGEISLSRETGPFKICVAARA